MTIREWWQQRRASEQRTLLIGGILSLVTLLWGGVYQPLQQALKREQNRIERLRTDLSQMLQFSRELSDLRATPVSAATSTETVAAVIERVAKQPPIAGKLTRIEPGEGESVRIFLDQVSYDGMAEWLVQLEQDHGLRIKEATLKASGLPGIVGAQIELSRD
jgi:general secretion pathway protein M